MKYGYKIKVNQTFEQSEQKLRHALTEEGFGVITEIDVKNVFKQKLFQRVRNGVKNVKMIMKK